MRFVQLRAFHHVAICGGFSRAAEMLHLTQPAISDQVRRLEMEYEVILFDRRRKQVSLTADGEQLLAITRRLFDTERQALDLLNARRAYRTENLRIIADSASHLLHVLDRFRRKFPRVRITLHSGNSDTVLHWLGRYDADIGVLGDVPEERGFKSVHLGRSPLVAFAAIGHPAAAQGTMRLRDLARQPLVLREQGSRTRTKLEKAAADRGLVLNPVIEAEGREAVREIVATGAGVGVVSQAEFGHDPRLRQILLSDSPELTMDESLICLRERAESRLIRAFFALATPEAPET